MAPAAAISNEFVCVPIDDRIHDENPLIDAILAEVRACLHRGLDFAKEFGAVTLHAEIADRSVKYSEAAYVPHNNKTDLLTKRTNGLTRLRAAG